MLKVVKCRRNGVIVEHTIDGINQLGLGDKIARIAQPIARAIDKVAGTKIAGCGGCKKMKRRLNAGMPIVEALNKRIKEHRTKSTKAHQGSQREKH